MVSNEAGRDSRLAEAWLARELSWDTTMTPERWKQVSQLYYLARARPVNERGAFLAEACGTDAALLREVESLLDQPTSPPGLEPVTPPVVTQVTSDVSRPALTGRRFGAYLVGERIDSGGMGDVYRARDTQLGRDVAISCCTLPVATTRRAGSC